MTARANRQTAATRLLQQIERELRRLKYWQDAPLPADRFLDMGPFGSRTMAFPQWLQFVFVPAAADTIAGRRDWPSSSDVATVAVREFDGVTEAATLIDLLRQFDALAEPAGSAGPPGGTRASPKIALRDAPEADYLGGIARMAPAWSLAVLYPAAAMLLALDAHALAPWMKLTESLMRAVDDVIPQVTAVPLDLVRRGAPARAIFVHHVLAMQWVLCALGLPFGLVRLWRARRGLAHAWRAMISQGGWMLRVGLDTFGAAFLGMVIYAVPSNGASSYDGSFSYDLASGNAGLFWLGGFIAVFWFAVYTVASALIALLPYRRGKA